MNGKVKVLLVVASLFCITSPALASASCQTKNDLKVCFYEKYTGISHHVYNISVESLRDPPAITMNISTLIDSTNFPASKIHNAKLYSYENITYTEEVFDHYDYVNGTLHDSGIVEDYNATHLNYTVNSNSTFVRKHHSPGAYDWSTTDNWWTENESRATYRNEERWEWRWQRAKEQYFKRNAERFTQGMGTFMVPPNPKWFRYEFDTPVRFWSKGRFALNVNDVQFDPWWSTTYKFKRELLNASNDLVLPFVDENPDGDGSLSTYYGQGNGDIYYNNDGDFAFANDTDQRCGFSTFVDEEVNLIDETVNCPSKFLYYWTFDNQSKDLIGGNNGTNYNFDGDENTTGKVKNAYNFDGTDDLVGLNTTSKNYTWPNGVTFSMWSKHESVADGDFDTALIWVSGSRALMRDDGNSRYHFHMRDPTNTWNKVSAPISNGVWNMWTGVWNTSHLVLYKNGTQVNATLLSNLEVDAPIDADLAAGGRFNFIEYFDGSVDDIRIYNRTLSSSEISALYNATKPVAGHDPRFGSEYPRNKIVRVSATDVHQGDEFLVTSEGISHASLPEGLYNWTIELPSGFSLPNDDTNHPNPKLEENESWMTSWRVTAPSSRGSYKINITGPINKMSQTIDVTWRAGLTSISIGGLEEPKWPGDTVRPRVTLTNASSHFVNASSYVNLTIYDPTGSVVLEDSQMSCVIPSGQNTCMYYDEYSLSGTAPEGDYAVLVEADPNGVDTAKTSGFSVKKLALSENVSSAESGVKKNVTGEHGITKSIIKENLTKELQNRWQNLNASYLNGTAIERVRKLADYLNQTRWGSYIASDLYEISKKGKNISKYINETRWLDKTASDLYDMSKEANSTAEAARKIADYINESRWTEDNATVLYNMAKEANSTAELARELADYINSSRWIDVNASELKGISVRARDLADYINGTRWGKYVAEDLRNMSDKARKIAEYINETRWKGFVAKDIFAEAESARKEAERTYEEMHDMKRILIKEMRKTVLEALGIKGPGSHSSSSSSPGGSSSVPSSSPKTLPTGKATESKSRGIIGKTVHFFARGVRGLSLIAQSVMGG